MTLIFIENILGSGQVIHVLEDFGDYVIEHKLRPGDNARIAISRFKSVVVNEALAADALAGRPAPSRATPSRATPTRRPTSRRPAAVVA